jgi:hypothetical protein
MNADECVECVGVGWCVDTCVAECVVECLDECSG